MPRPIRGRRGGKCGREPYLQLHGRDAHGYHAACRAVDACQENKYNNTPALQRQRPADVEGEAVQGDLKADLPEAPPSESLKSLIFL